MFKHNLVELENLTRLDGEIRYYQLPTGEKYPSVTTVLGAMSDKSGLDVWKKRVGEEEAYKIMTRSGSRGTSVHNLCEQFVLNKEVDLKGVMPFDTFMFKQIKKVLTENVDDIMCTEGSLYSHKFKVAGSVDLVAKWRGGNAIIDYKTSLRDKKKEWITNYFLQTACYSYMFWEQTGILCTKLVVIIAVEDAPEAQVFEVDARDWLSNAYNVCKAYHLKFSA